MKTRLGFKRSAGGKNYRAMVRAFVSENSFGEVDGGIQEACSSAAECIRPVSRTVSLYIYVIYYKGSGAEGGT